jgi:hypothetical protein
MLRIVCDVGLAEERNRFSHNLTGIEICVRICVMYQYKFIVSEKIGPVILIAFTAHHIPTITSCNGTLQINLRFSTDRSVRVTFRIYTSAEMKPSFIIKQNECRVCFSSIHNIKVPVYKIHL